MEFLKQPVECGRCGTVPVIKIKCPIYGTEGVFVKCEKCGRETEIYNMRETLLRSGRIIQKIHALSLLDAMNKAIEEWNTCTGVLLELTETGKKYVREGRAKEQKERGEGEG